MWDLPGPGLEPVCPAMAGGFLTIAPPGKPGRRILNQCATREAHRKKLKTIFIFFLRTVDIFWIPYDHHVLFIVSFSKRKFYVLFSLTIYTISVKKS